MVVEELDTPAVVVDLDVMERNLVRMANYCRDQSINLRPHNKTHKIPELARRQIESGAIGITVAKVGEAEVMVHSAITDVLIAYPVVGTEKAQRLCRLAERARLSVAIDSEAVAVSLSRVAAERGVSLGILVELDVGVHRCGFANERAALALAQAVTDLKGLEFKGLMFYPGHIMDPATPLELVKQVNDQLDRTYEVFHHAAIPLRVVSGGSTPTAYFSGEFHGVNEIRPGMYPFYDRNMLGSQVARLEDCAVSVIVTVVSTTVPGWAIVDGGSKTFSSDRYLVGDGRGFGMIKEDPNAMLGDLSEEHGHVNISHTQRKYKVGERLSVIPNHVCSTINMHDEIFGIRRNHVEAKWEVAARGRVR